MTAYMPIPGNTVWGFLCGTVYTVGDKEWDIWLYPTKASRERGIASRRRAQPGSEIVTFEWPVEELLKRGKFRVMKPDTRDRKRVQVVRTVCLWKPHA